MKRALESPTTTSPSRKIPLLQENLLTSTSDRALEDLEQMINFENQMNFSGGNFFFKNMLSKNYLFKFLDSNNEAGPSTSSRHSSNDPYQMDGFLNNNLMFRQPYRRKISGTFYLNQFFVSKFK